MDQVCLGVGIGTDMVPRRMRGVIFFFGAIGVSERKFEITNVFREHRKYESLDARRCLKV